ncbi:MAG TPA: hypothetical protein VK363_16815 [Pyrinomonadaceae bacterium]|nr:hypothetical protein [Pyrinomonadaceae bacterium]
MPRPADDRARPKISGKPARPRDPRRGVACDLPNPADATYDMGCAVNEKVKQAAHAGERRVLVVSTAT